MLNNDKIPSYLNSETLMNYLMCKLENKMVNIYTDNSGNVIVHRAGNGSKITFVVPINTEELYVTQTDDNKTYFKAKANINEENITDLYVADKNDIIGVIKKDDKSVFIETFNSYSPKIGDVYQITHSVNCKENILYGKNITMKISLNIAINLLNRTNKGDKDIYFTFYFSNNSLKTYINNERFDYILSLIYGNEENEFKISSGCGIVYKDGNVIISRDMIKLCKNASEGILHQSFFGNKDSLSESLILLADKAEYASVCIPIKYLNSNCEIADSVDIDNTVEILKNIVEMAR